MKTRNQVVASAKTKVAPEAANGASLIQSVKDEPSEMVSNESPSPPRLRERKTLCMELKPQTGSAAVNNQVPSSTADAKRPPIEQSRSLRRRSCSKPTSLLAPDPQRNSIPTTRSGSSPIKPVGQTGSRKDTQQCQQITASISKQMYNQSSADEPKLMATNKTANIKNYSRDIPSNRANVASKQVTSNDEISNDSEPKHARISSPDKSEDKDTNNSIETLNCKSNNISPDKTEHITTAIESRKTGTHNEGTDSPPYSDVPRPTLETENGLLNGTDINHSVKRRVFNVLIGVTGSVAAIKLNQLVLKLKEMFPRSYDNKSDGAPEEADVDIKIIMTASSKHFIARDGLNKTSKDFSIDVHDDSDEWELWKKMGDPVLHIELRKWADLYLIAPLDANTMAKLANGICDNLLTCVVRAWDVSKPLIYCPAMNVHMYNHPITRDHLSKLQSFGYLRVDCVEKRLACGDIGIGGMATIDSIANKVVNCLIQPKSRANPLSRPILEQQPTYPIISTPDDDQSTYSSPNSRRVASAPISTHQLLNRFKCNNQISIHAVSGNSTKPRPGSRVDEIAALALKRRKILNSTSSSYSHSLSVPSRNLQRPHHQNHTIGQANNRPKMGGVTSVQNLRAMGLNESLTHHAPDSSQDFRDNDSDVDFLSYLDPSRMLEQSMIIDDPLPIPRQATTNCNSTSLAIERSFTSSNHRQQSLLKVAGLTPSLETSKFLALCHNKERGCFTCAICKHDYKNRKSMARHLKEQHVQGSIFQCRPCGVSYKRREKLIKHNRERHGII